MMVKAVFLDRDGVINEQVHYLSSPDDFRFLPRAVEALKKLSESEYKIVVISNQSGVARGLFTRETLEKITDKMLYGLEKEGVRVDGVFYCTHHPDEKCGCRKPETGLIDEASKELGIEADGSYFIGDMTTDIACGRNAGLKTILVETGNAGRDKRTDSKPDYKADDLYDAVDIILG